MPTTYAGFQFTVFVSQPLFVRFGTSIRIVPNTTLKLFRKGTNTPAVIYSDDNFTVENTQGEVTTAENGMWAAFLDPTHAPYELEYKGQRVDTLDVAADRREADQDLENFSERFGLDDAVDGDELALKSWVTSAIQNFTTTPGLTEAQVTAKINEALSNFEADGGVSETTVNNLINAALDNYVPDVAVPSTSELARIRGDEANRDIIVKQGLPSIGTAAEWLSAKASVRDNKLWLEQSVIGQTPETQAPPITTDSVAWLNEGHKHFVKAYLNNGVVAASNTVNVTTIASSLIEAARQADRDTFDKIFTWAQANLRRTSQSNPKDLYGSTYSTTSSTVTSWTVDTGAMLSIFGALFKAWNLWAGADYRDAASKIFSDLVNYCTIADEGRLFLAIDETQKAVGNGGLFGHHVHPGNSGYVSAYCLGAVNPVHFQSAKTFFGSTVCDQLLEGHFALVSKAVAAYNLIPDYISYNTATHGVGLVTNGVDGWTVSLSGNFGALGQRAGHNLALSKAIFNEGRGATALTNLRAHYVAKWTANNAIYDTYTTAGAPVGTTETTEAVAAAIAVLKSNDPSNSTAAAIRAAKMPTTQGNDANGYYVPFQVKGVTPVASLANNQRAWLAWAKDVGVWADITNLGSNPNVGTLYPAGSNNTGGGTTTPPVVVVPPTTDPGVGQPVGSYKLYADNNPNRFLALGWAQGLPNGTADEQKRKSRALWFASFGSGHWIGDWDETASNTKIYIDDATAAGAIAQVLSYRIPGRDLGHYSAGGAANRAAYETYINNLCIAIGTRQVILCLEPDSLPHMASMSQDQREGRISTMDWAIRQIRSRCPNTWVYVDAGHSNWLSIGQTADLLRQIHIENAHGIATNVSNFRPDGEIIPWSQGVLAALNMPHLQFVYDSGRNGNSSVPNDSDFPVGDGDRFANPRRRQLGQLPQFGGLGIDKCAGRLWWKRQGESDGSNGDGAPPAGQFMPIYLYAPGVADRTNGSTHATSAGLLQRPPTAGVANG